MSRTELAQVMPWRERVPCNGTASRGHRLFEAYADQGLLVAKQQYTTLRLGYFLPFCPGEAFHLMIPFLPMT